MSALLNCPFCGADVTMEYGAGRGVEPYITCTFCDVSVTEITCIDKHLAAAWNRRAPPPLPTREALTAALAVIPTGLRNQAMHLPPAMAEAAADAVLRLLGGEGGDA